MLGMVSPRAALSELGTSAAPVRRARGEGDRHGLAIVHKAGHRNRGSADIGCCRGRGRGRSGRPRPQRVRRGRPEPLKRRLEARSIDVHNVEPRRVVVAAVGHDQTDVGLKLFVRGVRSRGPRRLAAVDLRFPVCQPAPRSCRTPPPGQPVPALCPCGGGRACVDPAAFPFAESASRPSRPRQTLVLMLPRSRGHVMTCACVPPSRHRVPRRWRGLCRLREWGSRRRSVCVC